ncbi:MAG: hypothetical protein V3V08_22545 [Nannocystaceae bacterium]
MPPTKTRPVAAAGVPVAMDLVLPCGLRLVVAQDRSLAVAAIVLAIDAGTRDDPSGYPGLVQTLAYHLLAGNRELRPGATLGAVHDHGGWAGMAIGAAQVRYESLVPLSQLERVLWAESQRLQAPNVNANLWLKSINYAKRDQGRKPALAREIWAGVWQDEGLVHEGRRIGAQRGQKLASMVDLQISGHLSRLFRYDRSTLVVVAPQTPAELVAKIRPLFADLPAVKRLLRGRPGLPVTQQTREMELPGAKGHTFVWTVSAAPGAAAWAKVWCDALNRQKRRRGDAKGIRLRCVVGVDPRRGVLIVRASGPGDPAVIVGERIVRLTSGRDRKLLERRRKRRSRRLSRKLSMPLEMATHLAQVEPVWDPVLDGVGAEEGSVAQHRGEVTLSALTGEMLLQSLETSLKLAPELLDLRSAVRLIAPANAKKSP